ncbi:MAG: DegT/DnrJ/EryC1/StrS family aminotransferase [Deltaproteobacteria bacterium]|nr:DegT/DnrJ/EryC1/StrS family aminotransferase [Deltaproteobacteria bacterium]
MNVPFFDMRAETAALRGELDRAIARVLDSGTFIGGEEVTGFEAELARHCSTTHAIGTSSGTDALLVLGMALGLAPGDEVVTTPLTFFATAGSFARLGATIVFADVRDDDLTLDADAALAACTARTRAIVPVHLFGHPAAIPRATCPVIEDSAQAIAASQLGGIAGALSFFPTKNLGALGDAGAVITDDDELADRVRLLRTHGARPKYHHVALGGNFRLDAMQAAVLRAKLTHLAAWTARRRAHAHAYRALFRAARVPAELRLPAEHPGHIYHQFVIRAPRRDALRAHLAASGIGTEVYYPELLAGSTGLAGRCGALPVATRVVREVLALPIYPAMPDVHRTLVVEAVERFYAS